MSLEYTVLGSELQLVQIQLPANNADVVVRGEPASMAYMSSGVTMETQAEGGLFSGLKRVITGESFFVCQYKNTGPEPGYVAFSSPLPGKLVPLDMSIHKEVLMQSDAFLCGFGDLEIDVKVNSIGTSLLAGEGMFWQRIRGERGTVFVQACGTVVAKTLGTAAVI